MILEKLITIFEGDNSSLLTSIKDSENKVSGLAGKLSVIGGAALATGFAAAAGGVALVTKGLIDSVEAASEAEDIQAQLNAVLESTGGKAGVTADMVNSLADKYGKLTKFEDDSIVAGENMLLTFTGIGKDVFPDVTQAMLDMSQAMNQDLKSTAIQLGKALNNPAEGLTALTRVGVKFTDQQEEMVKSMVAAGDTAGAQKIILAELATEFGGSAEAAGKTMSGLKTIFENQVGNIKESVGNKLLPVLTEGFSRLNEIVASPRVQEAIDRIGNGIASLAGKAFDYLPKIIDTFQNVVNFLANNEFIIVGVLGAIGAAIASFVYTTAIPAITALITSLAPVIAPFLLIGAAVGLLYLAWKNNFLGIRDTLTNIWNTKLKPIFEAIKEWLSANIPKAIEAVKNFWETKFLPVLQTVWGWINANLMPLFRAIGRVLGDVIGIAVKALAGLFEKVLIPALKSVWKYLQDNIFPIFEKLFNWLGEKLTPAFNWIKKAIEDVTRFLQRFANTLEHLKLPDWLTPGSPTPFEVGLVGISKALDSINTKSLATFNNELKQATPINTGNKDVVDAIRGIPSNPVDYKKLARAVRDEILKVAG